MAIVDAYASKYIYKDAAKYASVNDPSHPLRDYQFNQVLPAGYTHADECGASGWYGEETLDVEAVHATAPGAKILYVGAESCYDNDINAAVNTIVDNQLAQVDHQLLRRDRRRRRPGRPGQQPPDRPPGGRRGDLDDLLQR